jgi:hypothetical protein
MYAQEFYMMLFFPFYIAIYEWVKGNVEYGE